MQVNFFSLFRHIHIHLILYSCFSLKQRTCAIIPQVLSIRIIYTHLIVSRVLIITVITTTMFLTPTL